MKKLIFLFAALSLFITTPCFSASKTYTKNCLTGGTSNCLDSIDGALLADGDRGMVVTVSMNYFYYLSASSGASEDGVTVIAPDTNPDNKRWLLTLDVNLTEKRPADNATDQGVIGDNNTIKYYIDQAAGDVVTIHLIPGEYTLSSSLAIPENVTLKIDRGAYFVLGAAVTLTHRKDPEAGAYQIYDCSSGGSVVGLDTAYIEWFGALTDSVSSAFDSKIPFQKAIDSGAGIVMTKTYGQYNISIADDGSGNLVGLDITSGVQLLSESHYLSGVNTSHPQVILNFTGTSAASIGVHYVTNNFKIKGFSIYSGDGWGIKGTGGYDEISGNYILGANCIWKAYNIDSTIEHNRLRPTDLYGIKMDRGTSFTLFKNYISGTDPLQASSKGILLGDPTTSTPSGDDTVLSGVSRENIIEYMDYGQYLNPAHGVDSGAFNNALWLTERIISIGNYYEQIGTSGLYAIDTNFVGYGDIRSDTGDPYSINWNITEARYQTVQTDEIANDYEIHRPIFAGAYNTDALALRTIGTTFQALGSAVSGQNTTIDFLTDNSAGWKKVLVYLRDVDTDSGYVLKYDEETNILSWSPRTSGTDGTEIIKIASTGVLQKIKIDTAAHLSDSTSNINAFNIKSQGVMVFDSTNNVPVWATGSAATDTWVNGIGTVVFTPTP